MISRNNYEVFFLDYHEGNLGENERKELFSFLEHNPDLKQEFENFRNVSLSSSDKKIFDKDRLKRNTITAYNYKTWFIALPENDLNNSQEKEVEDFILKNPSLRSELELFKKTIIYSEKDIYFRDKAFLKRGGKIVPIGSWIYLSMAIAASIALILVFIYVLNKDTGKIPVAVSSIPGEDTNIAKPNESNNVKVQDSFAVTRTKNATVPMVSRRNKAETEKALASNELLLEARDNHPSIEKDTTTMNINNSTSIVINETASSPTDSFKESLRVFADDELAELGVKENESKSEESLLSKTAGGIGRLLGQNVKVENKTNEHDATRTFALAVGKFEFSRTTSR